MRGRRRNCDGTIGFHELELRCCNMVSKSRYGASKDVVWNHIIIFPALIFPAHLTPVMILAGPKRCKVGLFICARTSPFTRVRMEPLPLVPNSLSHLLGLPHHDETKEYIRYIRPRVRRGGDPGAQILFACGVCTARWGVRVLDLIFWFLLKGDAAGFRSRKIVL